LITKEEEVENKAKIHDVMV